MKANTSELAKIAPELKAGDKIELSGYIYTGRDAAHKRFFQLIDKGKELPFPIENATIYHAGPTGTKDGMVIGSCGPTTSGRMDPYAPKLLDMGLKGIIGKGERNDEVVNAIIRNKAVYFCAIGGAGALACKCIESCEVIAFEDLGCESVKKLFVRNFPLITAIDCHGGNLFKTGRKAYKRPINTKNTYN